MGCIIKLDSEKFINKFVKNEDVTDFQYILISDNISNNKKHKNVMALKPLMPPPNILSAYLNDGSKKEYKKKYLNYLKRTETNAMIAIIVKAVLQGMKIVLMCSKTENEHEYIDSICEYIEAEYCIKCYSYKKYTEDPKKAIKIKDIDEVRRKVISVMEKMNITEKDLNPEINKEKFMKRVAKLDKKELKMYCKKKGIKIDKDMDKKDIIKKIKKKLFKD